MDTEINIRRITRCGLKVECLESGPFLGETKDDGRRHYVARATYSGKTVAEGSGEDVSSAFENLVEAMIRDGRPKLFVCICNYRSDPDDHYINPKCPSCNVPYRNTWPGRQCALSWTSPLVAKSSVCSGCGEEFCVFHMACHSCHGRHGDLARSECSAEPPRVQQSCTDDNLRRVFG